MKRFRGLIIFVLMVITWLTTERVLYRRTVPPAGVTDLDSFLKWRPETQQFAILTGNPNEHLMARGPGGGLLPSGQAAYVFDRSGRMVDWSSDTGDDPAFHEKWQLRQTSMNGKSLPRSELSSWRNAADQTIAK